MIVLDEKLEALLKDEVVVVGEIEQIEQALNNKLAYLNKIKGAIEVVSQLIDAQALATLKPNYERPNNDIQDNNNDERR